MPLFVVGDFLLKGLVLSNGTESMTLAFLWFLDLSHNSPMVLHTWEPGVTPLIFVQFVFKFGPFSSFLKNSVLQKIQPALPLQSLPSQGQRSFGVIPSEIVVHVSVRILSVLWLSHNGSVFLHLPGVVGFNNLPPPIFLRHVSLAIQLSRVQWLPYVRPPKEDGFV